MWNIEIMLWGDLKVEGRWDYVEVTFNVDLVGSCRWGYEKLWSVLHFCTYFEQMETEIDGTAGQWLKWNIKGGGTVYLGLSPLSVVVCLSLAM